MVMARAGVEVARSVTRWEEWNGKPIQIEAAGAETERRWAREGNGLTVTMPVMVRERCEAAAAEEAMET